MVIIEVLEISNEERWYIPLLLKSVCTFTQPSYCGPPVQIKTADSMDGSAENIERSRFEDGVMQVDKLD